jgi:putative MATE family efflux protein
VSPLAKRLVRLALPVIGLNVLQVLALAVDTAMCGRLEQSQLALTALGFSVQVFFLLLVAAMGLTVGSVALVARAFGADDHDRVQYVAHQATMLMVGFGLLSATLGVVVAPFVLMALGASEESATLAMNYLRPSLYGSAFYYINLLLIGMLRGVGVTALPFKVALGSNVLNAVLNYGFILGGFGMPAFGVAGAAYGTVLSNLWAISTLIFLINRGAVPGLKIRTRPSEIDRVLAGQLWRIGWPAALDMIVLNAMLLSIVGLIGHLDEVAVAAHGVGIRVQSLAFVPGLAMSQAAGALIGQALGRGDANEARDVLVLARRFTTILMSGLGAVFIVFGGDIVHFAFDVHTGTATHTYAVQWIQILGFSLPIVGIWLAYAGLLHGSGATTTSLRINATTTLAVQIPTSFFLGVVLGWGPAGVWLGLPAGELLKVVLGHRAFKKGSWAKTGSSGR